MLVAGVALGVGLVPRLNAFTGPDFREGLVTPERPLSLDPLVGADVVAVHDVGHLLYRSLLRLDSSAYPQPDLASSYAVDQTGVTYTVELARGQRWSDGRAITVADVLGTLAFAQSRQAVDQRLSGALAGVRAAAQGDGGIVFTLSSPRASFAASLTQLPILPLGELTPKRIAALPTQAAVPMPTSGPYRVQSSDAIALELVANQYAHVKPKLGRLELRLYSAFADAATAFSKAEVDAVLTTTPAERWRLLRGSAASAHDIATFRFVDIIFNERVFGLDDPVVRQAIGAALERRSIVDGGSTRAAGVIEADAISRGLPWIATADPPVTASVTSARTALDADGWREPPDRGARVRNGASLSYTLLVPNTPPLSDVAAAVAKQVQGIGVEIKVDVVPAQTFLAQDIDPASFQMALGDWDPGPDPDVSSFWRSNAQPPLGLYVSGGPVDPFLDQALDELATLATRSGRVAAASSVAAHLVADAPAEFLYTPTVSFVMRGPLRAAMVPAVGGSSARYEEVASWQRS